eukprot:TRINITY_DN1858_c0_g1_i2.p1 TRINITY_DN1858_c0_g1~~TRINITY_DN1858_c0_g1_i2.p1  ORF type:complete len:229 (+),score=19.11 TRINITY_DN1858_c0_g1_i2:106-792(+)
MGTLSDLYAAARRIILELREGLERIERLEAASPSDPYMQKPGSSPDMTSQLRVKLTELQRINIDMEHMWRAQIAQRKDKDIWKRKVEGIAEETDSLRGALDKYLSREHRRQAEAKDRAELMKRGTAEDGKRVMSDFDAEAQAMASVNTSNKVLEDMFSAATGVLESYAMQRDRLKNAQRKALDVINTLGLSGTVLRRIDRRQLTDKWVSYVGMLVTILVVVVVWRWTR